MRQHFYSQVSFIIKHNQKQEETTTKYSNQDSNSSQEITLNLQNEPVIQYDELIKSPTICSVILKNFILTYKYNKNLIQDIEKAMIILFLKKVIEKFNDIISILSEEDKNQIKMTEFRALEMNLLVEVTYIVINSFQITNVNFTNPVIFLIGYWIKNLRTKK